MMPAGDGSTRAAKVKEAAMSQQSVRHSGWLLAICAVVAMGGPSCGGDAQPETPVAPVSVSVPGQSVVRDSGVVEAEGAPGGTAICHWDATASTWTDMTVPAQALKGHLKHGDKIGRCPVVACPCFTAADVSVDCGGSAPRSQCGQPYSLYAFCSVGSAEANLGEKIVDPNAMSCFRETWDPMTGDRIEIRFSNLTADQVAACKSVIINSPYYPQSCPR
jgi:hypothetical protein